MSSDNLFRYKTNTYWPYAGRRQRASVPWRPSGTETHVQIWPCHEGHSQARCSSVARWSTCNTTQRTRSSAPRRCLRKTLRLARQSAHKTTNSIHNCITIHSHIVIITLFYNLFSFGSFLVLVIGRMWSVISLVVNSDLTFGLQLMRDLTTYFC